MLTVGDQWKNSDGDAFGDNPLGPLPDACPTDAGVSSYVVQGCADYDTDGFRDEIDGCDDQGGRHGLTALVAKTEIKTAGLITSLAMLMATSTIPIGNKPLTPMAMVLAITTVWIAVQPALTRTPQRGPLPLPRFPIQ